MSKGFKYSYSAPTEVERREVEEIKKRYEPNPYNEKLERLHKLDGRVKNIPTCVALAFGIVGVLIFGLGMTLALEWNSPIWGVVVGFVGCILMPSAYFAYIKIYTVIKKKYSAEIIQLSNEILKEDEKK